MGAGPQRGAEVREARHRHRPRGRAEGARGVQGPEAATARSGSEPGEVLQVGQIWAGKGVLSPSPSPYPI